MGVQRGAGISADGNASHAGHGCAGASGAVTLCVARQPTPRVVRRIAICGLAAGMACATAPASAPRAVDGLRTLIDTVYFPVSGTEPKEWAASSVRAAARAGVRPGHLAMTGYVPRWTYAPRVTEFGCEPRNPVLILGIAFVMPRLQTESGVSASDLAAWQGYMRALWRHEEAHATLAMRSGTELRDSLRVVHSGECGLLQSHIEGVAKAIDEKYQRLQAAVDEGSRTGSRVSGQPLPFMGSVLAIDTTYRDAVP